MNLALHSQHRPALSPKSCFQLIPSLGRLDLVIAAILFLCASALAFTYLQTAGLGHFYQQYFSPAVSWACGGDFSGISGTEPNASSPSASDPLSLFLMRREDSFDCRNLPDPLAYRPLNAMERSFEYTLLAAGMIWRVAGVTWNSLNILGAVLGGLSGAFLFAL